MEGRARWGMFAAALVTLAGCPRKPDAGSAEAGSLVASADEAGTPVAAPAAANAADVARFPDETDFANVDATTGHGGTKVYKSPPNGEVIVTLSAGTAVSQVAGHESSVLIGFTDPKDATRKLLGWVAKASLSEGSPSAPPAPHGGGGTAAVDAGGGGGGGGGSAFVVNPAGGGCSGGFAMSDDGKCHKTCNNSVSECPPPPQAYCIKNKGKGGGRICSATK